jgi:hypothetical protein
MFLKKNKENIITFSCSDWAIRKFAPVETSENILLEDYKKLPIGKICPFDLTKANSELSAKQCPAIRNFVKYGYIIPAWCDIEIDFSDDKVIIQYSNADYGHEIHTEEQFQSIIGDQFKVRLDIKLNSPWHIHTASGYSCMWMPIFYHNVNYQALPAIVDTDINLNKNPINLMFFEPKKTVIKMGDPLVRVIPFKRENITAVSKKFDEKDKNRLINILNLNKLSKFGWRNFIKDKISYTLKKLDLDIDS